MANEQRGEVEIELREGETAILRYDWNALAELNALFGDEYLEKIVGDISTMRATTVRQVLLIGLKSAQPDSELEEVGRATIPLAELAKAIFAALGLAVWGDRDFFKMAEEAANDIAESQGNFTDAGATQSESAEN